jgi:hypothetical protein
MSLPTPALRNPNPPDWFLTVYRDKAQSDLDFYYLHAVAMEPHPVDGPRMSVDAFNTAAKAWLDDQTAKRAMSADPANYQPEPFKKPFPRREIQDIGTDGVFYTWLAEVDPNIHAPVLPPFAGPSNVAPNLGFIHTADPWQQMVTALLSQILAKVSK